MRILIALDHSECSQRAFDAVIDRCWPENTEFKLVNVIEPFDPIEPIGSISSELWSKMVEAERADRRARAETMLQEAASRLQANQDYDVSTHISEEFMPDQCIVNLANSWIADLIVLGSHSKRGLNRLLLGSVSHSVLLNAPCAVEIVKAAKQKSTSAKFNVLICLDDSQFSDAAFQSIISRPWKENTEFKIITVRKPAVDACIGIENSMVALKALSEDQLATQKAKTELEAKSTAVRQTTGRTATSEVLTGDPRQSIIQAVEDWPAHLVVLGSHGRTGLNRLLLGSVSQAVSLHAPCSIQVIKLPASHAFSKDRVAVASQATSDQ